LNIRFCSSENYEFITKKFKLSAKYVFYSLKKLMHSTEFSLFPVFKSANIYFNQYLKNKKIKIFFKNIY